MKTNIKSELLLAGAYVLKITFHSAFNHLLVRTFLDSLLVGWEQLATADWLVLGFFNHQLSILVPSLIQYTNIPYTKTS